MRSSRRQAPAMWNGGVLYVGGTPRLSVPTALAPAWAPHVGAVPIPHLPIPAFPVFGSATPQNPGPAPAGPVGPSAASLRTAEDARVQTALAAEAQGMQHTVGGESDFDAAAKAWHAASELATQIANMTSGVTRDNAQVRAYHYSFREKVDAQVASGQKQHPVLTGEVTQPAYGWSWPPIPQKPDPSAGPVSPHLPPGVLPGPAPEAPGPAPAPTAGGSGSLLAVGIGLLAVAAAVVYAGSRAGKRALA